MDIGYETTTYGGIDQRWIGGDHGFDLAESATVDLTEATVGGTSAIDKYGVLKGGTLLARVGQSDLLGVFDAADAERNVLFGVNTRDVNTRAADGTTFPKVSLGVLRHGRIHQRFLPVPAHRSVTAGIARETTELIFD